MTHEEPRIDSELRIARHPRVTYRDLEDGGVLLHLDSGAYHGLNPTGSAIWELLADEPTLAELGARLRSQLDDAPPGLDSDVAEFVESLRDRGLVSLQGA